VWGFNVREIVSLPLRAALAALTLIDHLRSGGTVTMPAEAAGAAQEIALLRDTNASLTGHLVNAIDTLQAIAASSEEGCTVREAVDALLHIPHGIDHLRKVGLK